MIDPGIGRLGNTLGDGFGYAVEFDPLTRVQQRFGDAGLREPVLTQDQLRGRAIRPARCMAP